VTGCYLGHWSSIPVRNVGITQLIRSAYIPFLFNHCNANSSKHKIHNTAQKERPLSGIRITDTEVDHIQLDKMYEGRGNHSDCQICPSFTYLESATLTPPPQFWGVQKYVSNIYILILTTLLITAYKPTKKGENQHCNGKILLRRVVNYKYVSSSCNEVD
jgi:hypothetical protein